jgi:DNA mismatch repair protein MutS
MAGMPRRVIDRAEKVLDHLQATHGGDLGAPASALEGLGAEPQLSFFQLDDPALEAIRAQIEALDIDTLTPVEALLKLNEIKRMVGTNKVKLRKA